MCKQREFHPQELILFAYKVSCVFAWLWFAWFLFRGFMVLPVFCSEFRGPARFRLIVSLFLVSEAVFPGAPWAQGSAAAGGGVAESL